ncbi:MAG: hypothetical protein L0Z73_17625 [Gammaproteobacteria bacterium]|nr:hypothetical protein [Gammaproteobacteria bacterium]
MQDKQRASIQRKTCHAKVIENSSQCNNRMLVSGEIKVEMEGEIIMGDYLEEILDNNDLEMDIMAALDEGVMLNDYHYANWRYESDSKEELDDFDGYYTV